MVELPTKKVGAEPELMPRLAGSGSAPVLNDYLTK